jgi:hypothetical protein
MLGKAATDDGEWITLGGGAALGTGGPFYPHYYNLALYVLN